MDVLDMHVKIFYKKCISWFGSAYPFIRPQRAAGQVTKPVPVRANNMYFQSCLKRKYKDLLFGGNGVIMRTSCREWKT